ncbi:hypothetical protein E3N88_10569 [Mikania micrantha]|uniref:Uncharacterized protein n=1 Tax=Mikania micrantha TaxID=192012 RepID=A0A5N6PBY7_9ASTR|nr:hypothetical protein E3N88_10569 [Mikania micrantha]
MEAMEEEGNKKLHVTCKAPSQSHSHSHSKTTTLLTTILQPLNMNKSPPKHPTITTTAAIISPTTPVSNLYDSYEFRAISKQLNRAIKGSNGPLSPYSCYLRSATPFYSKQVRHMICGSNTRNGVLCTKEATLRSKGFVWRLWAKVKGTFIRTN